MSHKIHHTDGFIVESLDSGEANRFLWIYTKDFGLIGAHAQGIRHMKSKLRYTLQDLSYCSVSLVRGRDVWRVTSATRLIDPIQEIITHKEKRTSFTRVLKLIRQLVNGEEKDDKLFETLHNGYKMLQDKSADIRLIKNIEIIMVLQTLYILGYLSVPTEYLRFIESDFWSNTIISEIEGKEKEMIHIINSSLNLIDM
ncbi:hypothetical protein COW81_02370 [Candidatus Campbellbacteria bacterium CG22_combo_CG10-13_8_21_14_all_36_13]|uniref:DNA replication/recombination mediator RecO N-terminal domain-containing protein n=1 Tax=Candidatus Campbellbacteria bacterium CG22_combo_CG10-13_8_21_14_all_36_13 TaxID=1974529 RepID=A0A2H0DZQ5_9BACT|nr:MAG: hypothetical protein COW81_02370 [Candidatus Campbellbacteria bacterium CG22_combo_CG10-13_8_21_14_all_36_13]